MDGNEQLCINYGGLYAIWRRLHGFTVDMAQRCAHYLYVIYDDLIVTKERLIMYEDATENFVKIINDDLNTIEGVLKNFTLRFSQPWILNDPLECRPEFEFEEDFEVDTKYVVNGEPFPSFREMIEFDVIGSNHNSFGILSLSKHIPTYRMWNMYSNNHKGISVIFKEDFYKRLKYNDKYCVEYKHFAFNKVEYKSRCTVNYHSILNEDHNEYNEKEVIKQLFFQKTDDWQYENEWRAVSPVKGNDDSGLRYYDNESLHLIRYDQNDIDCIVFGANCSKDLRLKVREFTRDLDCDYLYSYVVRTSEGPVVKYQLIKDIDDHISGIRESNIYSQSTFENHQNTEVNNLSEVPYIDKYPWLRKERFVKYLSQQNNESS